MPKSVLSARPVRPALNRRRYSEVGAFGRAVAAGVQRMFKVEVFGL